MTTRSMNDSFQPAARPLAGSTRALLRTGLAAVILVQLAVPAWSQSGTRQTGTSAPHSQGSTFSAPEIDPSLAGAALALLVGGVLLLTDRRRAVRA